MRIFALVISILLMPSLSFADWWNADWAYKKKISLDKVALQQTGSSPDAKAVALVRLHTGNFSYFLDVAEGAADLRFVAGDHVTELAYSIEKFDAINEMALIWVKLPENIAIAEEPVIWMYYGNPQAMASQMMLTRDGISLLYHFSGSDVADATTNANHPALSTASPSSAGVIAGAAQFDGTQSIAITESASLMMSADTGWAISMWLRMDQPLVDAVVVQRGNGSLLLAIKEQKFQLTLMDSAEQVHSIDSGSELVVGNWHHIVLTQSGPTMALYVDGQSAASMTTDVTRFSGDLLVGLDAEGSKGFVGLLDELTMTGFAPDENAIKFAYAMQGLGTPLLLYGEDMSEEDSDSSGEPSYIQATLENVSTDGWMVIGALTIMMLVSWMVMVGKGIVIAKIHKENANFIEEFEKLGVSEMEKLNREDNEDDEDAMESPLMLSLTGGHEKFQGSSIYRVYHAGVEAINHRLPKAVGADVVMSAQSVEAIRASMDASLVRELQRLNSQMVLLTIAISGGPFLGLLGTVLGVMITFAAIAVQGEVDVNAIAPGVAAALATTVAGLMVAIPALFGYNYLGSRIKEISADMYVFVDEFVAKVAERYS